MNKITCSRLFIFAGLFLAVIIFDLLKFLAAGKPTIVNWDITWPTIVHPIWVSLAICSMFAAAFFPRAQNVVLVIYLLIFIASLANVYLAFTTVLSYWCMIFNLVLVSVFYFAQPPSKV